MVMPDFTEFSRLAQQATLIPVAKTVAADLRTPVSAFLSIAAEEPNAFQRALGVDRNVWLGRVAATSAPPRETRTADACGEYLDHYVPGAKG